VQKGALESRLRSERDGETEKGSKLDHSRRSANKTLALPGYLCLEVREDKSERTEPRGVKVIRGY
jgi:hypothetical protein